MFKSADELSSIRSAIVTACEKSIYDHRVLMPKFVGEQFPHMLEDCQVKYARFKRAIVEVLRPKTVYEVGVGWGVSANAFYDGDPSIEFFGIDNGEMGIEPHKVLPLAAGYVIQDTSELNYFSMPSGKPIDLLHIDGGHGLEHKAEDIVRALRSKPEWILVDDIRNVMVAAGTFAGLYIAHDCPDIHMLYFENSHTGNLLIHADRDKIENRGLTIQRT